MPLQPQFSCSKTGFLINEVCASLFVPMGCDVCQTVRCIESLTVSNERNERVVLYSPSATKVSIIDRWNTHPVMSSVSGTLSQIPLLHHVTLQLWSTRLEELHNDVDGVIFAAPILRGYGRCDYERSVHASAERVIAEARVSGEGYSRGRGSTVVVCRSSPSSSCRWLCRGSWPSTTRGTSGMCPCVKASEERPRLSYSRKNLLWSYPSRRELSFDLSSGRFVFEV